MWMSYFKIDFFCTSILENLRDLCDTLISCENEAKLESGNEVMKEMDEDHYVNLLSDVIFGRYPFPDYILPLSFHNLFPKQEYQYSLMANFVLAVPWEMKLTNVICNLKM